MRHSNETVQKILTLHEAGMKSRKIANAVFGRSSCKSTVNDIIARHRKDKPTIHINKAKIAFLDVESQGTVALTHGRFKTNISPKAVISEPHLLSYAVNWSSDDEHDVECYSLADFDYFNTNPKDDILIVEQLWDILNDADLVVCHNVGFDKNIINARFAYHGIEPPSPYQTVCTLQGLRKYFRLPANSLDAATRYFELERKLDNAGIGLWLRCYEDDRQAYQEMKDYNVGDLPTLRQLYYRILPFLENHPNMGHYNEGGCRRCGSKSLTPIEGKYKMTSVSKFQAYRCGDCGSVQRTRKNENAKEVMNNLYM